MLQSGLAERTGRLARMLVGLHLLTPTVAYSQEPPLPDQVIERIKDQFRSRMSTGGIDVRITGIQPSEVPGFDRGFLVLSDPRSGRSQEKVFYLSNDQRFLFFGEAVDLAHDGQAEIVRMLSLGEDYSRGNPSAPVTIVGFTDFQCPACSQAALILEARVLKRYGENVRYVYKPFPLAEIHDWAEAAAIAAECAGIQKQQAFWELHDFFFERQDELSRENIQDQILEKAGLLSLDLKAFEECNTRQTTAPRIARSLDQGRALGVRGTPTFFVNGRQLYGITMRVSSLRSNGNCQKCQDKDPLSQPFTDQELP